MNGQTQELWPVSLGLRWDIKLGKIMVNQRSGLGWAKTRAWITNGK